VQRCSAKNLSMFWGGGKEETRLELQGGDS
jgi:hypothetical protein